MIEMMATMMNDEYDQDDDDEYDQDDGDDDE